MTERERIQQAIAALEAQRAVLGDDVLETALAPLRAQLAALDAAPAPSAGERKPITIVLADVKGSTDLAEQLSMEDWVETMNGLFRVLETEVYRFGGEVNQFRGDGLLAFFGARTVREDDPERAVLAALAMQSAVQRYADEIAQAHSIELALRVGVNTGEVIVTEVGDRATHSEGTAMGRAVAVAARMESAAEPGTVLVTDATHRLLAARFTWEPLGEIRVKGVRDPVTVYRPLTHRRDPGRVRGIAGLASPLVGRRAEFRALQEALGALQTGRGGIVTLVGEAGLGKSRLVAEVRQQTLARFESSQLQSPRWVEGRCVSYGASIAYLPWIGVLRGLLGVAAEDEPEAVQARLASQVRALYPERGTDIYPYLGRLLGASLEAEHRSLLRNLEAESLKEHTFRAVEYLIRGTARTAPLVIVCEDLHWADPTSLELLTGLFALIEHAPLLFVCVLRPERAHGCWAAREIAAKRYGHRHTDLMLAPLSEQDSERLVRNLLRVEALPAALKRRLLRYAEGNPFYVEEIIRALMDSGDLAYDAEAGRWDVVGDGKDLAIPDTLHGILMARIDRLPPETRRIVQLAAVIGRSFRARVLATIAEVPGEALSEHLARLQEVELIREQAEAEESYVFKHHLTQEAAYNSLLTKSRQAVHRQVAEAVKSLFPQQRGEHAGLLAYHWELAGEPRRALPHLIRAADLASRQFAGRESLAYLERALKLARSTGLVLAEADVLQRLSYETRYMGLHAEAREYLGQALAMAREQGNRGREGRLLSDLGVIARLSGDYETARESFAGALRVSRELRNWRGEAIGLSNLGRVCAGLGAYSEALDHLEAALHINQVMRSRIGETIALSWLGDLYRALGAYDRAKAAFERALELNRKAEDRLGQAIALANLGWVAHCLGDDVAARALCQQASPLVYDLRDRSGRAYVLTVLAHTLLELGRLRHAAEAYRQARDGYRRIKALHLAVEPVAGLVEVALRRKRVGSVTAQVEEVVNQIEATPALPGTVHPFGVYWTAYRALAALDDPRAGDVLAAARTGLDARAVQIEDEALRHSYVHDVRVHKEMGLLGFAGGWGPPP